MLAYLFQLGEKKKLAPDKSMKAERDREPKIALTWEICRVGFGSRARECGCILGGLLHQVAKAKNR